MKDVRTSLEKNGHGKLIEELNHADNFYSENIAPWYANKTFKGIINKKGKLPSSAELAKAIYSPNNEAIFKNLKEPVKKAALGLHLTKGRIGTEGKVNTSPKKIAERYSNLEQLQRHAIQSHSPEEAKLFENLADILNANKKHQKLVVNTEKKQEKNAEEKENYNSILSKALEKIEKAKSNKINAKREHIFDTMSLSTFNPKGIASDIFKLPWLLSGAGRIPERVLSDPRLIQMYINNQKHPGINANISKNLSRILAQQAPGGLEEIR